MIGLPSSLGTSLSDKGEIDSYGFMIRKGRKDIAQAIMKEAYLDREQCREAGLSDFDLRIITNIFENR
jgi:hypothetical protein